MDNYFHSFREALTRNEIIFKTLAATALSLMALIVSLAQLFTAREQISLAALQERIAEVQALPQFEVAIHQRRNNDTGKFDDDYLEVVNGGGPVHEFSAETAFLLRVNAVVPHVSGGTSSPLPSRIASITFDVPVGGYFSTQGVSSAGKGQLVTISGYHNNAAINGLEKNARQAADNAKWDAFNLDTLIYIKLRYRDMLDRAHEDYYEVPTVGGGWRMRDADGKAVFEKWEQPGRVEMSNLSAEQLLSETAKRIDNGTGTNPAR
jgi:hypothetical protein